MKFLFLLSGIITMSFGHSLPSRLSLFTSDKFDASLIGLIKKQVRNEYNVEIDSVGVFPVYNNGAEDATSTLADSIPNGYDGAIGLTTKGMYFGEDFFPMEVYGYTNRFNKTCIISDFLFGCCDPKHDTRMANVVAHEVGHIMGLHHCKNIHCLMVDYGHLDNDRLCAKCRKILKQKTQ